MSSGSDTPMQACLDRLRGGDPSAREDLLRVSQERLLRMTRKMLDSFPAVRRWEQSDDVLQKVLLRLNEGLSKLSLDSPRDFLRLAAARIRHVLIDLLRHYYGPEGLGAHHATPGGAGTERLGPAPGGTDDPSQLLWWTEFHERAGALPADERETFELLWYHGLTQEEAAALLGVSVRTVRRRWQAARLRLAQAFQGEFPI